MIISLTLALTFMQQNQKVIYITHSLIFSLYWICLALFLILLLIVLRECIARLKYDSLFNLAKSIIATYQFRAFLLQHEKNTNQNPINQKQSKDIVLVHFNKTIKKSVLDLTNKSLTLYIQIPKEVQAQKLLKEHENEIREHISSLYPKYILSNFERQKYNLWLKGTRRN